MASTPPLWSLNSTRLKIALALCLAIYSSVSMRASLSMSIVCMVNSTAFFSEEKGDTMDGCPAQHDKNITSSGGYEGNLLWSPSRQSTLFSASYYGSLMTMLLSGPMADKFGPKRILAGAIYILALLTLAAPSLARFDYWAFFGSRVVMGMAEGFVQPSANALAVRWFVPNEKSTMSALYTSGIQIAAGSSNLIGSWLCGVDWMGGWPLIFYFFALVGGCWLIIWLVYVTDHPSQHKFVDEKERIYLEQHVVRRNTSAVSIPWRELLTSRQVHACLLCNFALSFLVSINQNFLPLYLKEELRLPLSLNGLFTLLPFLTQLISKNTTARIADYLISSGTISPTTSVKIFQAIASFGSCLSILGLALLPSCHRPWIAAVLMVCYGIVFSGGTCGFLTSLLSIAPAYTGTLFSISMACGQLSSVLATYTVAAVTYFGWPHKWMIIFSIGAVIQLFSGAFFIFFGSGDPAEWAKMLPSKEKQANKILLE